jgi:hypothetical protein
MNAMKLIAFIIELTIYITKLWKLIRIFREQQ